MPAPGSPDHWSRPAQTDSSTIRSFEVKTLLAVVDLGAEPSEARTDVALLIVLGLVGLSAAIVFWVVLRWRSRG